MDLAVIKTGGKQYLVWPGKKITIEKTNKKEGDEIIFEEVFLLKKEGEIKIGNPKVEKAKVTGKIIKETKGEKILILKHKPRKRYKVKKGHRQIVQEVEILKIQ